MLHIPILRHGKPYESIDKIEIVHHATGEPVARVSQANAGLISRDMKRMDYDVLDQFTVRELIEMCRKAAEIFIGGTRAGRRRAAVVRRLRAAALVDDRHAAFVLPQQREEDSPHADEMDVILAGLTRGFDLSILDRGFGDDDGRMLSWFREARTFGAVLPSNSPGVHSLWIPADRDEDADRAEARAGRALDAAADDPGVHRRGLAAGGVRVLSDRSRRRRARSSRPSIARCSSATHRPPRPGHTTRASSCTGRATAR